MMPSISLPFCSPKTRTGSGCKQSRCRWVPASKWCAAHSRSLRPPPFSRSARQPTGNSHRQVRHASWPYGTRRSSEQSTISTRSVSGVAEPDMGTARRFVALAILCLLLPPCQCQAKLSTKFYDKSCPSVATVVRSVMAQAVAKEPRMGASIIRLFFHDCFVNGCDASILLDDTPTFTGEKNAGANANSVRGYEVIDAIKARVEAACKGTVSCADIVALASRDAVNLLRGPTWNVPLGRKDSRTASQSAANANLPGPGSNIASLISAFAAKGLSARDMTALSGAHTVGQARCVFFRGRIYTEPNINATFATLRRQTCPQSGGDGNLAPFDDQTPDAFDNAYYRNLVARRGLLHSDQELFNGGSQDALVRKYSGNGRMFANDFAKAMVRMGGLAPAAGTPTEVRLNCRKVN